MDLSYTDPSFHPIYSLQGISQSVLEVTIEMNQTKLFNYYYLFQELWKATSFNLSKRDDVFEPPYYFHFFLIINNNLRCTYFYSLICYFVICLFFMSSSINILFLLNWPGREFFFHVLFCCCCRCCCCCFFFCGAVFVLFCLFVCLGLGRWHPFFLKSCRNSFKRLPERVGHTWAN